MKFHAHQLVEALRDGAVEGMEHVAMPSGTLVGLLESAQCFYAGEIDLYERNRAIDLDSQFARLPFPVTYVEFEISGKVEISGNPAGGFIGFLALEDKGEGCTWLLIFHKASGYRFQKNGFDIRLIGNQSTLFSASHELVVTPDVQQIGGYYAQIFIAFLEALACSNVETVLNEPPAKLNKKRISKGRTPLFVFRTLHIKTREPGERSRAGADSERSGPRLHFRRGHIRRLPDRLVWVQPCMVGSLQSGMVIKDYEVRK
jgi:hypothetical protein